MRPHSVADEGGTMSAGSKIAILLMILSGLAVLGGIGALIADGFTPGEAERADIDMEAVSTLFDEKVRTRADLATLANEINDQDLFEGEELIQIEMSSDGSVLAWVDKNGDGVPTDLYNLETSAGIEEDSPPDSNEMVFRARACKKDGELVLADRYHHFYKHSVSEDFKNSEIWREMVDSQQSYNDGHHWHPPRYWVFVTPGYYRGWSSVRASSVGGRFGSGGLGGGK